MKLILKSVVVSTALMFCLNSFSATIAWNDAGSDSKWENTENWNGGVLPGSADRAELNMGSTISYDKTTGDQTVDNLELIGGNSDAMVMTDGTLNVNSRLGIHLNKLWLKGEAVLNLGSGAAYARNNNSSGIYFSTTESTVNAKLVWAGKSESDFQNTAGIWVDGTQVNSSNFTTYFSYNSADQSISLKQTTISFDNGAADTKWETATNWNTDTVPGASHKAWVNNSAYSITYDATSGSNTVDNLELQSGQTDIMTMTGGELTVVSRLGIHAQKLWLKGNAIFHMNENAVYVRNNNSSGIYFSSTESESAKFIWSGKSKNDFMNTAGIWVDTTQITSANFDTYFTYDATAGAESIALKEQVTPVIGLELDFSNNTLSWVVENEIDVKEYIIIDSATNKTLQIVPAGDTSYSVEIPDGVLPSIKVVDHSGYTQTFSISTEKEVLIELKAGWNLVSAPFSTSSAEVGQNIWTWDAESQTYEFKDHLEPQQGFWLFSTEKKTITLKGTASNQPLNLVKGWNLAGPSENGYAPEGLLVYGWDTGYQTTNVLSVGKGYWIYSENISLTYLPEKY